MGRFLDCGRAFEHPVTVWICAGVGTVLVFASILALALPVKPELRRDLRRRTLSWAIMVPFILGPILLGAGPTVAAVLMLSLVCFREYARATGLFRERVVTGVVVFGILALSTAVVDHWYGFFVALFPLTVCLIAAVSILPDRPSGYLQRVALGILGFMLFGTALGHFAFITNDPDYRPILLLIVLGVQMNDVFAYCTGKAFGRAKLAPNTSPNKTVAGAVGAIVLTTPLVATVAHFIWTGTELDVPWRLGLLGLITSVSGMLGDLMLSSIKRDIGIKDMGATIPGHGGVLDRANSLLLAAPAVFHYVGYFVGFGLDREPRIFF